MILKNKLLLDKNIGIWGFGVVGKSAAKYLVNKFAQTQELKPEKDLKSEQTKVAGQPASATFHLEILDKRELTEQEKAFLQENNIKFVNQNDAESFKNFLENNDLIIPSPGVDLRKYKQYCHKFISEFDLFQQELNIPIIGITGTVGKTTVTYMLDQIIKAQGVNIWTGGNIGTPVLDVLNPPIITQTFDSPSHKLANTPFSPTHENTSNPPSPFALSMAKGLRNKQKSSEKLPHEEISCTQTTNTISQETKSQKEIDLVLLELSSFQLELCKTFAPDLAVWTNFFPNHLDKHTDMQEYFLAKLQILVNQTPDQCALLPISLLDKLEPFLQTPTQIKSHLYFFSENKPAPEIIDKLRAQDTLFYLDEGDKHSVIKLSQENSAQENIGNIGSIAPDLAAHDKTSNSPNLPETLQKPNILPSPFALSLSKGKNRIEILGSITPLEELAEFTFRENLLIIFASLHIISENINKSFVLSDAKRTPFPHALRSLGVGGCQIEHRLEKVATINDITFYNDSKATTAASTIAAVQKMASKNKPIILLLGGLSKGVDRSPMVKEIKKYEKQVKLIISFGKEAEIIKNMCDNEGLPCQSFENMQQAVNSSFSAACAGDQILLSPSGSSFDLFKDYQDRGHKFKEFVLDLAKKK